MDGIVVSLVKICTGGSSAILDARGLTLKLGHFHRYYRASCCRYLWTKAIAMLPSPTAEATRFTGLSRTSPQAKIPGALDSRRYGSRRCDQRPALTTSSPVRT